LIGRQWVEFVTAGRVFPIASKDLSKYLGGKRKGEMPLAQPKKNNSIISISLTPTLVNIPIAQHCVNT
jgi:hypothetical protein